MTRRPSRRTGLTAVLVAAPLAAAWRFAVAYRARAGYPRRSPPLREPSDLGLPFTPVAIPSETGPLPGWWIPASDTDGPAASHEPAVRASRRPAVVLVHGWESARDRTLPNAQILHAAGFHVLTFDVRGHGANAREALPLTAAEFASDARAAVRFAARRPEVTSVGLLGHSMGGAGALIAAASEPLVASAVIVSAPAGPYRLTRLTFQLARLPLPDVLAYPLAWFTTHVFLQPRHHRIAEVSSTRAARTYRGPLLLVQGSEDEIVPPAHARHLLRAARRARRSPQSRRSPSEPRQGQPQARREPATPLRFLAIRGGDHSWLYENPRYRAEVARFLASTLPGAALPPGAAAAAARATDARRLPEPDQGFSALEDEPGGVVTLIRAIVRPTTPPGHKGQPA